MNQCLRIDPIEQNLLSNCQFDSRVSEFDEKHLMARVVKCSGIGFESATFVANSHPELGLKSERLSPILLCLDKPTNCIHTVSKVGEDLAAAQLIQLGERGMTDTLPEIEDLLAERRLFPIPNIRRLMSLKD
jgi:hypothetical protein